jgi:hypothetical protein
LREGGPLRLVSIKASNRRRAGATPCGREVVRRGHAPASAIDRSPGATRRRSPAPETSSG